MEEGSKFEEPIFKELVIEFIAFYEFDDDAASRTRASKAVKYRLDDQSSHLSWCLHRRGG